MPTTHPTTPASKLEVYKTLLLSQHPSPDLFTIHDSRSIDRGGYSFSAWVAQGIHVLGVWSGLGCACEVVTDKPHDIPEAGIIDAFFCAGERDAEHAIPHTRITHMTAAQTEQLPNHLYQDTYNELDEMARHDEALIHRWSDGSGPCLSVIDIQDLAREVHAQAYHMIAAEGTVVRTQTIFEIA